MLFYPQRPRPEAVATMVCRELGYRMVTDPAARFDIGIYWTTRTVRVPDATLAACAARVPVLNFRCRDIGKRHVDRVCRSVFGYGLSIDPRTHRGDCVRKSNLNATHDGVVVRSPVRRIDRSRVYQRVIDNVVGDDLVEDLRVPVFGDAIPFVLVGRKPVARRFDCAIAPVPVETRDVLSPREIAHIGRFSQAMGLDYAELDVLRDRADGRIFIVDANPTPWAPEVIPSKPFKAMDRLAAAFEQLVYKWRSGEVESGEVRKKSVRMISVVVITRNEGDRLLSTVDQYLASLPARSEVIVVDDGSTDGSCERLPRDRRVRLVRGSGRGVAQARNAGGRAARGSVLVFSDAHLEIPKGWWKPLAARAGRPGVGGVAPAIASTTRPDRIGHGLRFLGSNLEISWLWRDETTPRRAPLIPWCCTAMSRVVFDATGGFDEGMTGAGSIDNEMSLRLWLLGYELWVVPAVVIGHVFRRKQPYPAASWNGLHNRTRLALVHLEVPRIARYVRAWRHDPDFGMAMAAAATSDVARRRKLLAARRAHDSDWYFRRFSADA